MNNITKTILVSFITNILLSIIKIIFGILGKCSSLIADGIHSISDLSTDIIAILGNNLSMKPADKKHPFGHGKVEYITSMIIGTFIIILGFGLIMSAYNKEYTIPDFLIIYVSIFTIISKYILSSYVYKKGIKYENNILIASGKESKMDVYSSILVLISIMFMQFSNEIVIFKYSDLIVTIIIAILIIKAGYLILKDNISILLEEQIFDTDYINEIKNKILSFKEIVEIDELYILKYGPYYKLISNVIMEEKISLFDAHIVVDKLELDLKKDDKIKYVFIHMEPKEKY